MIKNGFHIWDQNSLILASDNYQEIEAQRHLGSVKTELKGKNWNLGQVRRWTQDKNKLEVKSLVTVLRADNHKNEWVMKIV